MCEYSTTTDVPLLSTVENVTDNYYEKKKKMKAPLLKSTATWVLKLLMWFVFVSWISLMFFLPSEFVNSLFDQWIKATERTLFGLTGSVLLAFSAPIVLIAFLSVLYFIISREDEEVQEKKPAEHPTFCLWTFPILVDGPFGLVSAAEFIGIIVVVAFVIWACAAYTV